MAREKLAESGFAEAAHKTAAILQELQLRLWRETRDSTDGDTSGESFDDLANQLQQYFGAPGTPSDIRERVIEAVVDRILQEWEDPQRNIHQALKNEVINRLMQRLLDHLQ